VSRTVIQRTAPRRREFFRNDRGELQSEKRYDEVRKFVWDITNDLDSGETIADVVATGSLTETFEFTDGDTLTVAVAGGTAETATFNTADFVDIAAATAAEVLAVIAADITGVTGSASGGAVVLTSSAGDIVVGGTGATILGLSNTDSLDLDWSGLTEEDKIHDTTSFTAM
jgi:hypothetical protein